MFNHPIHVQQLASDRRAVLEASARTHRLARSETCSPRRRRWTRRPVAHVTLITSFLRAGSTIPPPGTPEFDEWAASFGHRVAEHGLGPVERNAAQVAIVARRHGIETASAAILADRNQPGVARERALGRVLAALARPESVGTFCTATGSAA